MANDELTKEKFKDIFEDSFSMTNYAIQVARQQIHAGNDELSIGKLLEEIKRTPPDQAKVDEGAITSE